MAEKVTVNTDNFTTVTGPDEYLNSTRVPVYGSHAPAGTSLKNILHWDQIYQAKQPQVNQIISWNQI